MKQGITLLKAATLGALAGLTGTIVMTQCQRALARALRDQESDPVEALAGRHKLLGTSKAAGLADNASRLVRNRSLESEARPAVGMLGHYGLGTALGAVYGLVAIRFPEARGGLGLPFGFAVWLLTDEILMPALKVTRPPTHSPPRVEAYSAAAHAVFGVSTHLAERAYSSLLKA